MFFLELAFILLSPMYGVYRTWKWLNDRLTKLCVQSRIIDDVIEGKLHWTPAGIATGIVAVFLGVLTVPTLFHILPLLQLAAGFMWIFWIGIGLYAVFKGQIGQILSKRLKGL